MIKKRKNKQIAPTSKGRKIKNKKNSTKNKKQLPNQLLNKPKPNYPYNIKQIT